MNKFERWTIAYRRRNSSHTLLDDTLSPFSCIPNTWRYWCADPHVFEHNNVTYVFAELYDRLLRRGVIGYCTLTANGASSWTVALKMPFHLSYPHLFSHNGSVYMIPESYVANEITVYRALSFPDKWKKIKVLKSNYCAVDSTILHKDDKHYLLTLRFEEPDEKLMLYSFNNKELSENGFCVAVNDPNSRPAGQFFTHSGNLIRPAQDCTESYGCALNFYKVTKIDSSSYEEELMLKISPNELRTDLGSAPQGIHTYNFNDKYEVIDLKEYETDTLFHITRPIWFIWRRIKRFFKQ